MSKRVFILAAFVFAALSHSPVLASAQCAGKLIDDCYAEARKGSTCVFTDGTCQNDNCVISDQSIDDCMVKRHCLFVEWAPVKCMAKQRLCSGMTADGCNKNPLCSLSGLNCMYSVPTSYGSAAPAESSCPGFPVYSVALIFVWIFMIVILVFIVILIRKKPTRTEIEKSSIDVEGVGYTDNFQPNDLDEPLH